MNFFDKYITRPKYRRDLKEVVEFDVTRLASWRVLVIFPYVLLIGVLLVGLAENIVKFNNWGDEVALGIWVLMFLVPLGAGVFYFLIRKRLSLPDCKNSLPRFHTISHYSIFIKIAGIFAALMIIAAAISGKNYNESGSGYAALLFIILLSCILFSVSSMMEKTEAPSDIEGGRASSWTPEKEVERENELRGELQKIDEHIERLETARWKYPCRECNGQIPRVSKTPSELDRSVNPMDNEEEPAISTQRTADDKPIKDDRPPRLEPCSNPKCKDGKIEWANDGQKQAFDGFKETIEVIKQELKSIGVAADTPFSEKYLSFRFKWFTDQGHPDGDEIPGVKFEASEERLKKFRDKNARIFTEWTNFKDGADSRLRYIENISQWGKKYVLDEARSEDSRELKTLSYHLYKVVKENSLSELQQVELCAAAVRSLIKVREDVAHPPIYVIEMVETGNADVAKMERVKGAISLLWEVVSMSTDQMSREEREALNEKIRDWHERSQRIDDDDPEGSLQDCFGHIDELESWWWDTAGQNPESSLSWDNLVIESLTPAEHSDLVKDMESLNEINYSRNITKYNEKSDCIDAYAQAFRQHDLMCAQRKEFAVSHYPKFPTETLVDEEGTCDDAAILLAALLYDCGYRVMLFRSLRTDPETGEQEFMGVAVAIEGSDNEKHFPASTSHKGMIYCEVNLDGISCCEKPVEKISAHGLKQISVS